MKIHSNVAETFKRRLGKLGINVEFVGNIPWIYLHKVNDKFVTEPFISEHGFTAFWYPIRLDQEITFSDRRRVFAKVREML